MLKWGAIFVVGAYILGFFLFVTQSPRAPRDLSHVDGIVALTGGEMRIDAAYALLRRGIGQRLLISGVYPETTKQRLLARMARDTHEGTNAGQSAIRDRIDIGYAAENTHGNAREAAAWARFHAYHTLLIVTARYHMPRALSEFRTAMPGITVLPYPIDPEGLPKGWWHDIHAQRLLHGEYVKYLAASLLQVLDLEPKRLDRTGS